MKSLLAPLFILCLFFSSCDPHPPREKEETEVKPKDSDNVETVGRTLNPVILKEPLMNSMKHYFSDTAHMDSFAIEIPAGNILTNKIGLRIYQPDNKLIFADSIEPAGFYGWDTVVDRDGFIRPEAVIADVRKGIMGMFSDTLTSSFTSSGADEIKNAQTVQIANMIGWNEVTADTSRIVFRYMDESRGLFYLAYSHRLKKAVVIVKIENEDDD
jgi:hypothetical protein